MDFATTTKPFKLSSNISDMVSKFAKACRLRSIGIFLVEPMIQLSGNLDNNDGQLGENSSDATEEKDYDGEKVHPQPVEAPMNNGDCEIIMLFYAVSALKLAYIQLQKAHIPYNPDKIVAADKLVMAELEALCRIKRVYKEQLMKFKGNSSHVLLIREMEVVLEKLKSQLNTKEAEVFQLQNRLWDLEIENRRVVEKIRHKSLEIKNTGLLNVGAFQDTFEAASKSIHDFAKPLISLMKASGWDLDLAADSITDDVPYSKRSHKKYAFEAYIARRMFSGTAIEFSKIDNVIRFNDPVDALIEDPNSGFARFCREKYLLVVHQKMESSFFGNLDHRTLVLNRKHPRTPFYQIFTKMAKWVWILKLIAASIEPKAATFVVKRGSYFSDDYMVTVEGRNTSTDEREAKIVEFMVMPGFRIGDNLVKSVVYVTELR